MDGSKDFPMTSPYTQGSPRKLAQDDLSRIDAQIAQLQEERERVVNFLAMLDRYEPAFPLSVAGGAGPPPPFVAEGHLVRVPLNVRIGNFMAQKLATIEKPIPINTVFEMLASNNLMPGARDPKQAVSAILSKDKRFKYSPGEGWSLVRPTGLINLNLKGETLP
jgi:hypothetical protein